MTARRVIEGHVVAPGGLLRGRVVLDGPRIVAVEGSPVPDDAWRDAALPLVVPGFIDLHVHGGGGADTMQAADDPAALDLVARTHLRHGTTAMLATTMTAPMADRSRPRCARHRAGRAGQRTPGRGARARRAPGRTLHPARTGSARSRRMHGAAFGWTRSWRCMAIAPLRVVTLAPELRRRAGDLIVALAAGRTSACSSATAHGQLRAGLRRAGSTAPPASRTCSTR
jgi:N-acetylglucosamine-6-phosphate deacetylase